MGTVAELRQYLGFIAAGIDDLVPYGDGSDPDAARCPECWWIWPEGVTSCAGCGYPDAAPDLG